MFIIEETTDFDQLIKLSKSRQLEKKSSDYFETLLKFECVKKSLKAFTVKSFGALVGYIFYNVYHLENNPEIYFMEILLDEQMAVPEIFQFGIKNIKQAGGKSVYLFPSPNEIELFNFYQKVGAKIVLECVDSEIALESCEQLPIKLDNLFKIYSFKDLKEKWGNEVFNKIFSLVKSVLLDIPGSEESSKALTVEILKNAWSGKQFLEEGSFFILEGDKPVGIHNIVTLEDGEVTAGVTGILRDYRRKGLMKALKSSGINWAIKNNYKKFVSSNEKGNPMLQLNYQLGFKKISSSFQFKYSC